MRPQIMEITRFNPVINSQDLINNSLYSTLGQAFVSQLKLHGGVFVYRDYYDVGVNVKDILKFNAFLSLLLISQSGGSTYWTY